MAVCLFSYLVGWGRAGFRLTRNGYPGVVGRIFFNARHCGDVQRLRFTRCEYQI